MTVLDLYNNAGIYRDWEFRKWLEDMVWEDVFRWDDNCEVIKEHLDEK